jgi:hypothetical protein
MPSLANNALIEKFGGRETRFADLSRDAQRSMSCYMAWCGEAWDNYGKDFIDFESVLDRHVEVHGDMKFGLVTIPVADLCAAIMGDEGIVDDFASFNDYHEWYLSLGNTPRHPVGSVWPVILSDFDFETLQDGWHRFHHYVRERVQEIPALYYIEDESYAE